MPALISEICKWIAPWSTLLKLQYEQLMGNFKPFIARLSILFRSTWNGRNISYQFKKRNKTEQISSHFKSRSVPDFSAKFRPKCSGFIPHVPFRSWKSIESYSISLIKPPDYKKLFFITIFNSNDINNNIKNYYYYFH